MKDTFLNPVQAGKILGVTRQQVLKYIYAGILPSVQYSYGGRHHIKEADVLALRDGKESKRNK